MFLLSYIPILIIQLCFCGPLVHFFKQGWGWAKRNHPKQLESCSLQPWVVYDKMVLRVCS